MLEFAVEQLIEAGAFWKQERKWSKFVGYYWLRVFLHYRIDWRVSLIRVLHVDDGACILGVSKQFLK
jgi:hypothetical protein